MGIGAISNLGTSYMQGYSPVVGGDFTFDGDVSGVGAPSKATGVECQTCKERTYQDGSDENVSFKTAKHLSPEAAASAVRAHEGEHVANAYSKAAEGGGKVLQASVAIHTSICPECGRTYVSGGLTTTKIRYTDGDPYQDSRKKADAANLTGLNFDKAV